MEGLLMAESFHEEVGQTLVLAFIFFSIFERERICSLKMCI